MSEYPFHTSSINSSLHPFSQHSVWHGLPSDQNSGKSEKSFNTVQHRFSPRPSPVSASSRGSISSNPLVVRNENISNSRNASHSSLPLTPGSASRSSSRKVSYPASHTSKSESEIFPPLNKQDSSNLGSKAGFVEDVNPSSVHQELYPSQTSEPSLPSGVRHDEKLCTPRLPSEASQELGAIRPFVVATSHPFRSSHPFKKWIGNLHHNNQKRPKSLSVREERWTLDDFDDETSQHPHIRHRKSTSGHTKVSSLSSSGFMSAVKSAAATLKASNVPHEPHRASKRRFRRSYRSSKLPDAISSKVPENLPNQAAWERTTRRQSILYELVKSEESYVADLKVLLHVYLTIFDSVGSGAKLVAQEELSRNVEDMLRLHEDLLTQLRWSVLHSEIGQIQPRRPRKLSRYKDRPVLRSSESAEGIVARDADRCFTDVLGRDEYDNRNDTSWLREAIDVAKVFERMLGRFFVYEEYGAQYETMLRNKSSMSKTMPNWSAYQRGVEALVNSLVPATSGVGDRKKALTFDDLSIKPLQRVCKYPLLFAELRKYTPAIDSLESRAAIEKVLSRLRETASEINKATNDPLTQAKIQRSWHLQDLLVFPDTYPASFSIRLLGHASLCGVLYVAYRTHREVSGNYMLCALFTSYLLLALPEQSSSQFKIVAIMSLGGIQIDSADNGRGVQCCTVPFSWKIVFDSDQQLYELMLCACSAREEDQWKAGLIANIAAEDKRQAIETSMSNLLSFERSLLWLDLRPLGAVFGQAGTLTRRLSIQRASSTSYRKNGCRIIIKNTTAFKDNEEPAVLSSELSRRSHASLSTDMMPVLMPKRAERQRMEQSMHNVWTRDTLPYPGVAGKRGSQLIRSSATSMMRKLSKASTTTNSTTSSVQRTTSHKSSVDISLDLPKTPTRRMAQTDGASSPPPEEDEANSQPQPKRQRSMTASRWLESSPTRRGKYVTKLRSLSTSSKDDRARQVSGASTVLGNEQSGVIDLERAKPSKSNVLSKALSSEGIRGWFHQVTSL